MKKIHFLLIISLLPIFLFAEKVDIDKAKTIAKNFISHQLIAESNNNNQTVNISEFMYYGDSRNPELFIFNIENNNGYVIMPVDDRVNPVLAYSLNGNINNNFEEMPPAMMEYLNWYRDQIKYIIENDIAPTTNNQQLWNKYFNNNFSSREVNTEVLPLLQTTWNQGCYYNDECPVDNGPCNHVLVGCVATAMGQMMKYYNFPSTGTGYHGYNSDYGYLDANFGGTVYNWDSMPVSSANFEVAQLLYHCGVSVDMDYGPTESGANMEDTYNSFINYFNYSNRATRIAKWDYNETDWENMLKANLNISRPLCYSGYNHSFSVGHLFVCDGYDDNNLFHFNWGWSGAYDGYFLVSSLTPAGNNFNFLQTAIFNLSPDINLSAPQSLQAQLNDTVVSISWTAPNFTASDTVFQFYRIYKNGVMFDTTSAILYADSVPESGYKYDYHITAVYTNGESNFSNNAFVIVETPVVIPDTNFKVVLNEHLGYSYPDTETHEPTDYELSTISPLHAWGRGITDITGIEYLRNCAAIDLRYNEIFAISEFEKSNPDYLETRRSKNENAYQDDLFIIKNQDNNSVTKPTNKKSNRGFLTDLTVFAGIKKLGILAICGTGCSNLSGIENLIYLHALHISDNFITDDSILSNLIGLTTLNISGNPLNDFSFLNNMTQLTFINIIDVNLYDINWVVNMPYLRNLSISYNNIPTLSGIESCTNLESLHAEGNLLQNILEIENLSKLEGLYITDNNITDANLLSNMSSIKKLDISDNPLIDFSFLNNMPQLTYLSMSTAGLNDLSCLNDLSNLTHLVISNNNITTLEGIDNCSSLTSLDSYGNPLYDIRGIENLPLDHIYLNNNKITDFNPILMNQNIMGGNANLYIDFNPVSSEATTLQIPIFQANNILNSSGYLEEEPLAACYPIPINGTQNFPVNDTIRWQANFDSIIGVTYDFYMGSHMYNQPLIAQGLTESKFKAELLSNTNYWWRIETIYNGDTIRSCVWNIDNKQSDIEADFSADVTSGNTPLSVHFNNFSTGNPTNWYWDFGDGISDSTQNPTHTYQTAGTYTVSLIASDSSSMDTLILIDYISVLPLLTQSIELSNGWNIISFNIEPDSINMIDIVQPLVNSSSLVKVVNEVGGFIQEIPGIGWINTIGDMENTEGYYIRLIADDTILINGINVPLPFDIPLQTGWNMMGFPLQDTNDAINILQPIIDSLFLVKVIDESGGFIQNIPGVGWINTINNFRPGEGYYIKVNTNTNLIFREPATPWQCGDSIVDLNGGQSYSTVLIDNQCWMAQNLASTKYNDGTEIPLNTDNNTWGQLTIPAYCWYSDDSATYSNPYGALYNWHTVNTGMLCPTGWHVSTDAEWTTLITYLGGESVAGGKLKETDTEHWNSPNTDATNEVGFTSLPGGYRPSNGAYLDIGNFGYWWSSTEGDTWNAWKRSMSTYSSYVYRSSLSKVNGYSVRCVKD